MYVCMYISLPWSYISISPLPPLPQKAREARVGGGDENARPWSYIYPPYPPSPHDPFSIFYKRSPCSATYTIRKHTIKLIYYKKKYYKTVLYLGRLGWARDSPRGGQAGRPGARLCVRRRDGGTGVEQFKWSAEL
jgi:hypothetical protein